MLRGSRCKPPQTSEKIQQNPSKNHAIPHITPPLPRQCSYLDDERMRVGNLVLRRHVLLHGLAGTPDGQQDECVGQENDSAGDDVAEEEEADDVAHCRRVLAGRVPVDAAGCAIRLGPVLPPARQGADGENTSVAPDPCDQHVSVVMRELVTCGREIRIRAKITTSNIRQFGYTQIMSMRWSKFWSNSISLLPVYVWGSRWAPAFLPQVMFGWMSWFPPHPPGCYLTCCLMSVSGEINVNRKTVSRSPLQSQIVCREQGSPRICQIE